MPKDDWQYQRKSKFLMPSRAEPPMQDSKVQNKINSMAGKISIVISLELEEKMKNASELSKQVMDKVDGFITKYYRPEANNGNYPKRETSLYNRKNPWLYTSTARGSVFLPVYAVSIYSS